jgi:rod shape-determining protein MreD
VSVEIFKRLGWFVLLCVVQVLVLNNIHLFGVATPLLYVWFPLTFHRNTPQWAALLWSFALGLAIDVFSNTPGLAAGSLTLIGMI